MAERRFIDPYHPITQDEFGDPVMLGVDNFPQGCWQALPSGQKQPKLIEHQHGKKGSLSKAKLSGGDSRSKTERREAFRQEIAHRAAAGRR